MTMQQTDMPTQPHHKTIAQWAYQIYVREGCPAGRALDHWVEAETHMLKVAGKPVQKTNGHKKNGERPAGLSVESADRTGSRTPPGQF